MKSVIYLTNQRMPTEKAYGIQITKMCEAFAVEADVELVIPTRRNSNRETMFGYYGVKSNFRVKTLFSPDFYFPGKLDKISFPIKNFLSALVLSGYVLLKKADIIFSRDELPLYMLSFFKKNLIFEAHKYSSRRSWFYRRFKKAGVKIITISVGLKDEFVKFGFGADKILVAHDGVDLEEFDLNISKEEARKKKYLPLDKKMIMYTGHLFSWKGVDTLAMAAKILPDVDFVFIGGTDRDLNNFRDRHGYVKNIKILGHKPHTEIPIYLKSADVLVLPNSAKEKTPSFTSPLKLFEYMASGRPIVTSDLSSIREILNDHNSVLFIPDDPKSLAEAIQNVLKDQELSRKISEKAAHDVEDYTWAKRAGNVINFYKIMIKDKSFYNNESARYSVKRYPKTASNYIQFFYKKRLDIVLRELKEILGNKTGLSLLEVGCADGVVLRKIDEEMHNNFLELIGIDTSEGMIREAVILTTSKKIRYFLRGEEPVSNKFDVVLEVGVANYADIDDELKYAENNLKKEGVYILSLAGDSSVNAYFGNGKGYNNFLSYFRYENKINGTFEINKIIPLGFYLPLIWKVPAIARVLQSCFEVILGHSLPNLFHEKVYFLRKKP